MAACLARVGAAAEPAEPALLPLLADREEKVRQAAAAALEQIGPRTVPALIEIVQTRDLQRLETWFETMIKVSRWYTRPQPDTGATGHRRNLSGLSWTAYDFLEERASLDAAQVAALRLLGEFGPAASTAVPTVTQALADSNPRVKLAAVQALGKIGPVETTVTPDLIKMLTDDNKSFRQAAADALGQIDPNQASDPVIAGTISSLAKRLSKAGKPGKIAVNALTVLGAAAVPALIEVLESGDRVARENAATTLGRIGAGAQAAIPALTRALEDDHPWVQDKAAKALAKIQDHAA
jgi:HEAT repeat protein